MEYDKIIELSNVTLEDCEIMYRCKEMSAILNDGELINFIKEAIL